MHRSLVKAYKLGDGGLPAGDEERFEQIGEQISMLERRAMEAERETVDRYVAAYLSERVGELVETRITGVQSFGFFATVEGLGGDGLVPVSTLGTEYFRYDEASQTLKGEETETAFAPGQPKAGQFFEFFVPALTGMVGFWATLSLNIPDFSRYAKSQRDQALGQAIGLPTTMALYAFIGVAVTSATVRR